jgi:hypothetical protein
VLGAAIAMVAGRPRRTRERGPGLGAVLVVFLLLPVLGMIGYYVYRSASAATGSGEFGGFATLLSTTHTWINILLYPVAVYAALVVFEVRLYRLLTIGFRYGERHTAPLVRNTRVHQRIEEIERAQYGNITTYNCWSPFVGAGRITRSWSLAVDLVKADALTNTRTPVPISPLSLHEAVRQRVIGLRDDSRPVNERVNGLLVQHHIAASGTRDVEHPLIDESRRTPYAFAMPETIEALIGHPQAGARYYQRITVTTDGTPVRNREGRQIAEAEDQEVGVSAFVYFAVEGGMLYVEFVLTTMPPIRSAFHLIDALPRVLRPDWYPKILGSAAGDLLSIALPAPLRLLPRLLFTSKLTRKMENNRREADEFLVYDYGARKSIREFGGESKVTTYMQQLDVEKYGKLIERKVNEAVIDYLVDHDIDVNEYRQSVKVVQNTGVLITGGDVSGQIINASVAGAVTQTTPAPVPA